MKRALILAAVLGAGMSVIFFLPPFKVAESAMSLEIPKKIGEWETKLESPTEKEIKSLALDTRFSKASCVREREGSRTAWRGPLFDQAEMSIVLSGQDLANSIHRPERCMAAQGHAIYASEKVVVAVPGERQLPTRRLLSKVKAGKDKDLFDVRYVTYYFFVGKQLITEDHRTRVLADMRNRLENGEAQKWAYVLVSLPFKEAEDQDPHLAGLPDLETADRQMRELLGDIAASNINWQQATPLN
jgi:hypothetical protein